MIDPPGNRGILSEQMAAPFSVPGDSARDANDGRVRR
jgi:hypothetical protein